MRSKFLMIKMFAGNALPFFFHLHSEVFWEVISQQLFLNFVIFCNSSHVLLFSFEFALIFCRRFRGSNFQSTVRVKPYICTFPVQLDAGWNQIVVDLAQYCKKVFFIFSSFLISFLIFRLMVLTIRLPCKFRYL